MAWWLRSGARPRRGVLDHVEYLPRAAWLSRPWVQRDVERIFAYRRDALLRALAPQAASGSSISI
jgi:hypothetical protein